MPIRYKKYLNEYRTTCRRLGQQTHPNPQPKVKGATLIQQSIACKEPNSQSDKTGLDGLKSNYGRINEPWPRSFKSYENANDYLTLDLIVQNLCEAIAEDPAKQPASAACVFVLSR